MLGALLSALVVTLFVMVLPRLAWATPTRILVAVGHGQGDVHERPLRYAEQDAVKVVGALTSLGGVSSDQVILLRKPSAAQLRAAMGQAQSRAAKHDRRNVTFIFFFSGHGDRTSLRLGNESLALTELTRLVQGVSAGLRLVVIDACRSSRDKGMSAEEGFAISLGKPSGTTGTAWLFASADGEAAQESDQLGGAVFTHAWVTGLRGAADADGDRRVSLAESYAYAYHETLYRSARGAGVLQRPSAKFDVTEVAPITLTTLGGQTGFLLFPKEADAYYLVYAPRSRTVTAELWSSPERVVTLGLPPGRYVVHRRASGKGAAADVAVAGGEERALALSEFRDVPLQALAQKGGALVLHPWEVEGGYGIHVARTQSFGHRLLLRSAYALGDFALSLTVDGGRGWETTEANEVQERWLGFEPALEWRLSLGYPTIRFGLGPSLQYVGQTVRRSDAQRVELAGYLGERAYEGSALGAHGRVGLRLPLPLGRTFLELGSVGSWHGVKTQHGTAGRWAVGGTFTLGTTL
jgi:hypothetical protein